MNLPYRNTVKHNKKFNLNLNYQYKQKKFDLKPRGFWYQIKNYLFKWGEFDWGNYIYEVKIKTNRLTNFNQKDKNKILVIRDIDDLIKFDKKYGIKCSNMGFISWSNVENNYGGIEIKNYEKILKDIGKIKNYDDKYTWFLSIDFSSGCIWNLDIIREINYFGKAQDD